MSIDMCNGGQLMENEILRDFFPVIEPYPLNDMIACALRFCFRNFRNPYEGFLVTDKEGIIQFMDRPSEKFFGLEPGGARGIDIAEMMPLSDFKLVISTGTPIIGRIRQIGGITRIGSVYPLKRRGEVVGAIGRVVFHSFQEIDKRNKEIQELRNEVQYLKQREKNAERSCSLMPYTRGASVPQGLL